MKRSDEASQRPRLGLRARLVLVIALVIAATVAVFATYFPRRLEAAAADALRTHATAFATGTATLVTPPVQARRADEATAQLAQLGQSPDLRYVSIVLPDGTGFAHRRFAEGSEEERPAGRDSFAVVRGGLLHVATPIGPAARPLGTLVVGFSQASVAAARASAWRAALGLSALVLLLGLGVAWFVSGTIARPLAETARRMSEVSANLLGAARAQEAASAEEASAIEETRATMDVMLDSAQRIADAASAVLGNAERTAGANRQISTRIAELNGHAENVTQILASIMQVADRTDLLALNAALEGTKAGEAGKGFILVAAEMRRLAENVMESVANIRKLMQDVKTSSGSAVEASQGGTQLSEETTRSARDIALVTQQQRQATEQVTRSMDEMASVLGNTVSGVKHVTASATALAELAAELSSVIATARGKGAESDGGAGGDASGRR